MTGKLCGFFLWRGGEMNLQRLVDEASKPGFLVGKDGWQGDVALEIANFYDHFIAFFGHLHFVHFDMWQGKAQDICFSLPNHFLDGAAMEDLRWVLLAKDLQCQVAQRFDADNLAGEVGRFPDGQRSKGVLYLLAQLFLIVVHLLHEGILVVAGLKHTVADHTINGVAEERQVGFGAQSLFNDHTLRVNDRSIRADIWIGQYFAQGFYSLAELVYSVQ